MWVVPGLVLEFDCCRLRHLAANMEASPHFSRSSGRPNRQSDEARMIARSQAHEHMVLTRGTIDLKMFANLVWCRHGVAAHFENDVTGLNSMLSRSAVRLD